MNDRNRFAPPAADVHDIASRRSLDGDRRFRPEGRALPASAGWHWFGFAWRLFKGKPLGWWAVLVLIFGSFGLASLIPVVSLLTSIAFPIMVAGLGACACSQLRDGDFQIREVFAGFGPSSKALFQAGGLYAAISVLSMACMLLLGSGSPSELFLGSMAERQKAMSQVFAGGGPAVWAYVVVMCLAMSGVVFSPYLIHERQIPVLQAFLMSGKACFRNFLAGLVWVLSYLLWAVVATIPVGLGWLVLLPVVFLTSYVAYCDNFYE